MIAAKQNDNTLAGCFRHNLRIVVIVSKTGV